MQERQSLWWKLLLGGGLPFLLAGCPPKSDPSLSPPLVRGPIYRCSKVIAYTGADRDSRIHVYVNGTKVTEVSTWIGWGSARLSSPLKIGDLVTATQVVGGGVSEQTRQPAYVIDFPPILLPYGKLRTPRVVPPLYDCQKVVKVNKVMPGAEVVLRNNDADTWKSMTPYSIARLGTPKLKAGQWYNAMQQICEDPPINSSWSAKESVQQKPATLPTPAIAQPVVYGSDACAVQNLIAGSTVEITADDGSGPIRAGGGTALEAKTIFKVNPAFTSGLDHRAKQSLCDVNSPASDPVKPLATVPAPKIQEPICDGNYYVTLCNTVLLSTTEVWVGGAKQVAQAAGNGGCVKLALGNANVFATGDSVTALQKVGSKSSAVSAPAVVVKKQDLPPSYNPGYWNHADHVRWNNCYNYGSDFRTDTYAQPGRAHGSSAKSMTCADVAKAAIADGLVKATEGQCTGCTHKVALVMDPGRDYHWYRLDDTGRWSHKPASYPATNLDASDKPITNPETADRDYTPHPNYTTFCGYYCVDKGVVLVL